MTREQMTKNIYHQTSINGRGSGWLAMLIHEVTGTVNALRNCSDEQLKKVAEGMKITTNSSKQQLKPKRR